jgi:alcohol dehydrogenase class IV
LHAARLLGGETGGAGVEDAGEILASQIERIMRRVGMPNGLSGVGLGTDDVDALVAGTLPQHRVTKLSPRPATAEDLRELFLSAMRYW